MPQYDFRCERCGHRFALFYKSYALYDAAAPQCPQCAGDELARLITGVAIAGGRRDYARMSSNEMLSVLEGGDRAQVDALFRQVGGGDPSMAAAQHQKVQAALAAEKPNPRKKDSG